MKNFLNYNYNLFPRRIYRKDEKCYFFVNNYKIYICECNGINIDEIVNVSNELFKHGINVNTVLINKFGNYISKYNNKSILLLRVNYIEENKIEYASMKKIMNISPVTDMKAINLLQEWENEVDSIENELLEYNNEYPLIKKSFDYFIGCAENAIQFYNSYVEKDKITMGLGHYGFDFLNTKSFMNPLYIKKIDTEYEKAIYVKIKYIFGELDYDELYEIIKNSNNLGSFFSCLLYPTIYLHCVKQLLLEKNVDQYEKKVKMIVAKEHNYKKIFAFFQKMFKSNKKFQLLDWFNE